MAARSSTRVDIKWKNPNSSAYGAEAYRDQTTRALRRLPEGLGDVARFIDASVPDALQVERMRGGRGFVLRPGQVPDPYASRTGTWALQAAATAGSWLMNIVFTPATPPPPRFEVRCEETDGQYRITTYANGEQQDTYDLRLSAGQSVRDALGQEIGQMAFLKAAYTERDDNGPLPPFAMLEKAAEVAGPDAAIQFWSYHDEPVRVVGKPYLDAERPALGVAIPPAQHAMSLGFHRVAGDGGGSPSPEGMTLEAHILDYSATGANGRPQITVHPLDEALTMFASAVERIDAPASGSASAEAPFDQFNVAVQRHDYLGRACDFIDAARDYMLARESGDQTAMHNNPLAIMERVLGDAEANPIVNARAEGLATFFGKLEHILRDDCMPKQPNAADNFIGERQALLDTGDFPNLQAAVAECAAQRAASAKVEEFEAA